MVHKSFLPILATLLVVILCFTSLDNRLTRKVISMESTIHLLTDPFLQFPTSTSVKVVWFTEFAGQNHQIVYGPELAKTAIATTTKLSRVREDQKSFVGEQITNGQIYQKPTLRNIWRHEGEVTGLVPGSNLPYQVVSISDNNQIVKSDIFNLAPAPTPGTALKILLTSDHQLKPMTSANLQKVTETVGKIDAVFFAADLVNAPDRASEWFDDQRGNAFFPNLQGHAHYELEKNGVKTIYTGSAIIQSAPLFIAVGNHEVMGRFSDEQEIDKQYQAIPIRVAEELYAQQASQLNLTPEEKKNWIRDNSFNSITCNEIFHLPQTEQEENNYYAVTFGDIRLVVLYITNIWRSPEISPHTRGKYTDPIENFQHPSELGYGQHIFEPIQAGSKQYNWLVGELNSPEFQQAKYKIVMFHHPPHSLGENIVPAYTDPIQVIDRDQSGAIVAIRYEYPRADDYIIRDIIPLLESAGVQLVFYGHSHLWNRFVSDQGMHFLESSNVGNSYGAHVGNNQRRVPTDYQEEYVAVGDGNGLLPIMPSIAPLLDENGNPLPYIASNDITAFSILETATGTVSSYRFDTQVVGGKVIKFDEFYLKN